MEREENLDNAPTGPVRAVWHKPEVIKLRLSESALTLNGLGSDSALHYS